MEPTLLLMALAIIGLAWYQQRANHELAAQYAKKTCANAGVQLLDDTVSLSKMWLSRNDLGRLAISRSYTFDYTADRVTRAQGSVSLIGKQLLAAHLQSTTYYH
ncbi:MAG: DUF3301 domain-containing protein [Gammaproteobacteria bacterium]|nr:DUF3301 domain-containing protein [Gammaproteobacteria bacterium]